MMDNTKLPFGDQILKARNILIISLAVTAVGTIISLFLLPWIFAQLQSLAGEYLYTQSAEEGFLLHFDTALFMGFLLTLPFHFIQILGVLFPQMDNGKKRAFLITLAGGYLFFLLGIILSVSTLLPLAFWILNLPLFGSEDVNPLLSYKGFLNWALHVVCYGGIMLLVPVTVLLLLKGKIMMLDRFKKRFPYFIVGTLVAGMVITPPDIISQLLFAVPIIGLTAMVLPFAKLFMWGVEWTPE